MGCCNKSRCQNPGACSRPSRQGQQCQHFQQCQQCHQQRGSCHNCSHIGPSQSQNPLHSAIAIPLAIMTGGLSCAAFGIYRGISDHRAAKQLRKAEESAIRDGLQSPSIPAHLTTVDNTDPEKSARVQAGEAILADVEKDTAPPTYIEAIR